MKLGIAATIALSLVAIAMLCVMVDYIIKKRAWLRERRREPTTHGDDGGRPSSAFDEITGHEWPIGPRGLGVGRKPYTGPKPRLRDESNIEGKVQ